LRSVLLALVLLAVFAASALNLLLGGLWVVAFLAVGALRRRVRHAAWLVLALTLGAATAAYQAGRLAPPAPLSYATGELGWLARRLTVPAGYADESLDPAQADPAAIMRRRLGERRREELRYGAHQLEQRAVAAIAVGRGLARLSGRAPAEVGELEDAVRRLALTLTTPEFRDLEVREARLVAWLADLETRLTSARDVTDLEAVGRALDAAAMAPVSLRPVRDDLARVAAASATLVRALTGGAGVVVSGTARLEYDETRGQLVHERRFVFEAAPPLRLTRLDVGGLRQVEGVETPAGVAWLTYAVDGAAPRSITGAAEIALGEGSVGAGRVDVIERRDWPVQPVAIGTLLRPIRFQRLDTSAGVGRRVDFPARVAFGEPAGLESLLVLEAPVARLEGAVLPRHAFHYATLAGAVTTAESGDHWVPADPALAGSAPGLQVELRPPRGLLRNAVFSQLRTYLYTPNAAAVLGCVALAALASVVVRPRPAAPSAPGGTPGDPRS
jgi:hypothetical protein